jgi:hypothetical protein
MTSSHAARSTGSTPAPTTAPNITALVTVAASRAAASMSKATRRRLCVRATSSRRSESKRPSPSAIFSAVVSVRAVEVTRMVRSGLTMPLATMRAVSSSSEDTTMSTRPGTGYSESTGARSARCG